MMKCKLPQITWQHLEHCFKHCKLHWNCKDWTLLFSWNSQPENLQNMREREDSQYIKYTANLLWQ